LALALRFPFVCDKAVVFNAIVVSMTAINFWLAWRGWVLRWPVAGRARPFTLNMSFIYFVEKRSKRQLDLFGLCVPPGVGRRMVGRKVAARYGDP
jgi:hypothetical protein